MKLVRNQALLGLLLGALVIGLLPPTAMAAEIPLMTKDELKAALDDGNVVILDARAGKDWKSSEFKIKGAQRTEPKKFDDWGTTFDKGKKLVLYCA